MTCHAVDWTAMDGDTMIRTQMSAMLKKWSNPDTMRALSRTYCKRFQIDKSTFWLRALDVQPREFERFYESQTSPVLRYTSFAPLACSERKRYRDGKVLARWSQVTARSYETNYHPWNPSDTDSRESKDVPGYSEVHCNSTLIDSIVLYMDVLDDAAWEMLHSRLYDLYLLNESGCNHPEVNVLYRTFGCQDVRLAYVTKHLPYHTKLCLLDDQSIGRPSAVETAGHYRCSTETELTNKTWHVTHACAHVRSMNEAHNALNPGKDQKRKREDATDSDTDRRPAKRPRTDDPDTDTR